MSRVALVCSFFLLGCGGLGFEISSEAGGPAGGSRLCVTITGADDGEALTARVEGGVANLSFGSLAVEGGEASACVDLCTCAPDAELGDLIVVRADGTEENLGSVGTASSMCCESM